MNSDCSRLAGGVILLKTSKSVACTGFNGEAEDGSARRSQFVVCLPFIPPSLP